ncbi:MAG: DUF6709 family protein [Gemmataceae bacterium]
MWDNLIGRQIRRSSRNLFIWNTLILVALVVAAVCTAAYWLNFFAGPFGLDRNTLLQMPNADVTEYFVTVEGDSSVDTGHREIKNRTRRGRVVGTFENAKYALVDVGDKWLVVKVDLNDSTAEKRYTGTLVNTTNDARTGVTKFLGMQQNRVAAKPVLPVMLDATGFRLPGWIGLGVGVPLALLCSWNVLKAVKRFGNPQAHPLARTLEKYGDPEEIAAQIEEQSQSDDVETIAGVTFMRSWLMRPTTFGVDLVHFGDAAWVYKTTTKHYRNGIHTGTTYGVTLCDIHGSALAVPMAEKTCDDYVDAVRDRVPWVLAGHDTDLEKMWKTNKQSIYDLVEQRRQEFAEQVRRKRDQADEEPLDVEPAE